LTFGKLFSLEGLSMDVVDSGEKTMAESVVIFRRPTKFLKPLLKRIPIIWK
jgi:hypothetical protein